MKSLIAVFIKSFVFLTLLLFIYNLIIHSFKEIEFLSKIIIPSLILTIITIIVHIILSINVGVKSNFTSSQIEKIHTDINLEELSKKIGLKAKWKLIDVKDNSLIYKSKFESIKSFGEIITIKKDKSEITICSESILFSTLFDFGKNYQNIKLINSLL